MKKERFFENLIMESKKVTNRKLVVRVAVIAVLILAMAVTTGCGKKKNKENTPVESSQSVTQEVTPSTSEAQESTAEVVESTESATVETVESTEETESEVNLVEEIDTNKYDGMTEWLEDADYDEPKLTVWLKNTAFLLSDGASYKGDGAICLYTPGGITNVKDVSSNVYIEKLENWYYITPVYLNSNEENEITCNITYNDGTQDTITVYFTWILE